MKKIKTRITEQYKKFWIIKIEVKSNKKIS